MTPTTFSPSSSSKEKSLMIHMILPFKNGFEILIDLLEATN